MDLLRLIFLVSLGLSLVIGLVIFVIKRNNPFYFFTGIFTLKPVFSTIWIIGSAFLFKKIDVSLTFGHLLIIFFLPDFLIGIILVIAIRDVVLESWLSVLVYLIDAMRWLIWLATLATLTDFIEIVEMVALSTPGFVAIINIGILFLRSKQGNELETESNSS